MNPATAIEQIMYSENERHPPPKPIKKDAAGNVIPEDADSDDDDDEEKRPEYPTFLPIQHTLAMTLSRVGTSTQRIISGTLEELSKLDEDDFGGPLHSMVIVGKRLHPLELEYAGMFAVNGEQGDWWKVGKEVYGVEREGI